MHIATLLLSLGVLNLMLGLVAFIDRTPPARMGPSCFWGMRFHQPPKNLPRKTAWEERS